MILPSLLSRTSAKAGGVVSSGISGTIWSIRAGRGLSPLIRETASEIECSSLGSIWYYDAIDASVTEVNAGDPLWIDGKATTLPDFRQYLVAPTTPASQTTESLLTGTYTLEVYKGDGSASVAGNTATITGGGAATRGNPVTFEVTGAGTVDITVSGDVGIFQLHDLSYSIFPVMATSKMDVATRAGTQSSHIGAKNVSPADPAAEKAADNLLDALAGGADGPEVVTNGDFETGDLTGWSQSGVPTTFEVSTEKPKNGIYSLKIVSTANPDGTNGEIQAISIGSRYEERVDVYISALTSGNVTLDGRDGDTPANDWCTTINPVTDVVGEWVTLRRRGVSTASKIIPKIRCSGALTVFIDNYSFKEISPASADIRLDWEAPWNIADVSGEIATLSFDDGTTAHFRYDATAGQFELADGTNTATYSISVVGGTKYQISLRYDGSQMQIVVNGVGGSLATFAGTFSPDVNFVLGPANELQIISPIRIEAFRGFA